MKAEWAAVIATVSLAFLGYIVTYVVNLLLNRRKERLELINKQINEFYGPLFIAYEAGKISFRALEKKFDKKKMLIDRVAPNPDDESYKEWRLWLVNVLMPLNDFREKIILDKAYLIREEKMPTCLLNFIAHVAAYKVVIKKWEQGDFSEHLSTIGFPDDLGDYVKKSYKELKQEQILLIGKKSNEKNQLGEKT